MERKPDRKESLDCFVKLQRASNSLFEAVDSWSPLPSHLNLGRFEILEALYHKGALCQREIGAKVLKSKGSVSVTVEGLVRDGLVTRVRDEADRRLTRIELTGEGRRVIAGAFGPHAAAIVRAFSVLSRGETAALASLCRKLGRGIERAMAQEVHES